MFKYPRTHHLAGSRLQPGDEDLRQVPLKQLRGRRLVIEEKVDGANAAVWFDEGGDLRLQSRGHILRGGPQERQFALLKRWAHTHREWLHERLGARYVMYGEWMYAKHTIFYDALPHYFLEYDVLDRLSGVFLDTPRRRELLAGTVVVSVPVLMEELTERIPPLADLVTRSQFKSEQWRTVLERTAAETRQDVELVWRQTDACDNAEGLYVKVEENGVVTERLKWIRFSFFTSVVNSESHWMDRPILPNRLHDGVEILA